MDKNNYYRSDIIDRYMSSKTTDGKHGLIALAVGCLLLVIGVSTIETYKEVAFSTSNSKEIMPRMRDDISNWLKTRDLNRYRAYIAQQSRREAVPYLASGCFFVLILFYVVRNIC